MTLHVLELRCLEREHKTRSAKGVKFEFLQPTGPLQHYSIVMKICIDCKTETSNVNAPTCANCGGQFFTYGPPAPASAAAPAYSNAVPTPAYSNAGPMPESTMQKVIDIPPALTAQDLNKEITRIITLQNEIIQAQNRTTHAVRAFVTFLFIQLAALTIGYFMWEMSQAGVDPYRCAMDGEACEGNSTLQLLAVATWIVGVIWSSAVGRRELEWSEI